MKKTALFILALMALMPAAAAYSTIVSLQVSQMSCSGCAGTLNALSGGSGNYVVRTGSTQASCTTGTLVGTNKPLSIISTGASYVTDSISLTAGTQYVFCLTLPEAYTSTASMVSGSITNGCPTATQSSVMGYGLSGATCGGSSRGFIGSSTIVDSSAWSFPFTG